jgi:hypothetical protein
MIGVESWDDYHKAAEKDEVIHVTKIVLQALARAGHELIGITNRPGKWREITTRWLVRNEVPLSDVLMRGDDDYRQAPQLKLELARARFGEDLRGAVGLLIEDRDDVVSAFMAAGVPCIHVRGGATG